MLFGSLFIFCRILVFLFYVIALDYKSSWKIDHFGGLSVREAFVASDIWLKKKGVFFREKSSRTFVTSKKWSLLFSEDKNVVCRKKKTNRSPKEKKNICKENTLTKKIFPLQLCRKNKHNYEHISSLSKCPKTKTTTTTTEQQMILGWLCVMSLIPSLIFMNFSLFNPRDHKTINSQNIATV